MVEVEEIDDFCDRVDKYMFPDEVESDWLFDVWKRKREKKKNEKENRKIKSQGTYGRLRTFNYLREILEELEEDVGYLPILHEKIFLSKVDLDFGTLAKNKKVTSTLYFEPSSYFNGEFICYDNTNDSIAWIRIAICTVEHSYLPVIQNSYGSKAEEILREQLIDGIDIAIEKFLDAGKDYLEKLEAENQKEEHNS